MIIALICSCYAVGYGYGGLVGGRLSWEWAFILEAIPMAPLIVVIWFVPYNRLRREVIAEVEDALDGKLLCDAIYPAC
jgi:hypothetical protein